MLTPVKTRLGHTLFLGSAPGWPLYSTKVIYKDLDDLAARGVKKVFMFLPDLDLLDNYGDMDYLLDLYAERRIDVVRFPIRDFAVPRSFRATRDMIEDLKSSLRRQNVLIHCAAGLGRTGLIFSCLLVSIGYSPKDAIATSRKLRPGTVETPEQVGFVYDYYTNFRRKR